MTDTAVAPLAVNMPAFMAPVEGGTTGLEDMGSESTTPRIQLAQSMSPQVKKKDEQYIEGLEEGMFFHALTGEVLGESFDGYILKVYSSRAMFTEDSEIDCYSQDNTHGSKHSPLCKDCPFSKWGEDKTPPACKVFENFLVLPEGADVPALLSVKQSNKFATAEVRNIRSHLRLHGAAGAYAAKYSFKSRMVSNARKQSYFVTTAHPTGFVQDKAKYEALKELAEKMAGINTMEVNSGKEVG